MIPFPLNAMTSALRAGGVLLPSEAAEAFPIWEILSILPIHGDQEEQRKEPKSVMQCAHSK